MSYEYTDKLVKRYTTFNSTSNMLRAIAAAGVAPILDVQDAVKAVRDPQEVIILANFIKHMTGLVPYVANIPRNGQVRLAAKEFGVDEASYGRSLR